MENRIPTEHRNVGKPFDLSDVSLLNLSQQTCRECGCSDYDCGDCIEKTGGPCHWVEDDLCSACVPKHKPNHKN